jgi:uracil-DNA glycosylase family 4
LPVSPRFSTDCHRCKRLHAFLQESRQKYPDYICKPVPSFGSPDARLLVVGLAPGLHGANATGRPFTGDYAGLLLYETLFRHGFASRSESLARDDGLELYDCRITNAVRCVPPQNKPVADEINNCNAYLAQELEQVPDDGVVLALGQIAHKAVVRACGKRQKEYPFGHGLQAGLDRGIRLVDSYHCSRYNTQTRRLTAAMFDAVFRDIRAMLGS